MCDAGPTDLQDTQSLVNMSKNTHPHMRNAPDYTYDADSFLYSEKRQLVNILLPLQSGTVCKCPVCCCVGASPE